MTEEKKDIVVEQQGSFQETIAEDEIAKAERAAGESGLIDPEEYWKNVQVEVARSQEESERGAEKVVASGGDPEDVAMAKEAGEVLVQGTNDAARDMAEAVSPEIIATETPKDASAKPQTQAEGITKVFDALGAGIGEAGKARVDELVGKQGYVEYRSPAAADLARKQNPTWKEEVMPDGAVRFSPPEEGVGASEAVAETAAEAPINSGEIPLTPEEEAINAAVEKKTRAEAIAEGLNPDGTLEENSKILNRNSQAMAMLTPEEKDLSMERAQQRYEKEMAKTAEAPADAAHDSSLEKEIPEITPEEVLAKDAVEGEKFLTKERNGELRAWLKDFRGTREGLVQKQKELEKLGTLGGLLKRKEKAQLQAEVATLEQEYKAKRAEYVGEKAHRFLNEKTRLAEEQVHVQQKERGFGQKAYDAYKKMGEWNLAKVLGKDIMQKLEAKEDDDTDTRVQKSVARFATKIISVRTAVSGALLGAGLAFGAGAAAGMGAMVARRALSGVGVGVGSYDLMTIRDEMKKKGEDLRIWKFKLSADKDKAKLRDLKPEEATALSNEEILTRLDHFDVAGQLNGINPKENPTYQILKREFVERARGGKVEETMSELGEQTDANIAAVKAGEQSKKTRRKIIAGAMGVAVGAGGLAKLIQGREVSGGTTAETIASKPGSEAPVMALEDHSEAPVGRMVGDDSFTGKIEKGGSVWKATKDLLKQKADDLGTNKIAYEEALKSGKTKIPTYDAWLNQKTQELVDDLGRTQGGDVRDFVHKGDSIIVKQGINDILSLEFEETSGIDSDYLPYDADELAKALEEKPRFETPIRPYNVEELEEAVKQPRFETPVRPYTVAEFEEVVGKDDKWTLSDEYTGGKKHSLPNKDMPTTTVTEVTPKGTIEKFEGVITNTELLQRASDKSLMLSHDIMDGKMDTPAKFLREMKNIKGSDLTDLEKKSSMQFFNKAIGMKNRTLLREALRPRLLKFMQSGIEVPKIGE